MPTRWLALAILCPTTATAGVPGEDAPIVSVHADGITDSQARSPLGLGAGIRVAIPLADDTWVPDLELRFGAVHSTLPPKEIEAFILDNPAPDSTVPESIRFSRWEARFSALASWSATERTEAPRVRAGLVGLVDGTAGAQRALDPIGWGPDYSRSLRMGPTAAVGWAMPFGDEIGDPMLDVRIGGSVLQPVAAGGGLLSSDLRDEVLTVEEGCDGADCSFAATGWIGRETRAFAEGTFTVDHFVAGVELGLEHNARSPITRARARSPRWDTQDVPETADPYVRVTVGWMF